MKRTALWLVCSCWVMAVWLTAAPEEACAREAHERSFPHAEGEVLVKFRKPAAKSRTAHYERRWNMREIAVFGSSGARHLALPEGMDVRQALDVMLADPDVEYAEPNYLVRSHRVPDDGHFGLLWALHNTGQPVNGHGGTPDADIDAPEAWEFKADGRGVVVAVIDSGADYRHPDLSANVWLNPDEIAGNGLDDDGNGYVDDVRGWDFGDEDNEPMDPHGHGTHVTGTAGAVANNGLGVAGVSWNSRVMILKFLDASGSGLISNAIRAMEYAAEKGASVINCSWGGGGYSQALKDAIDASPAVVVCSAGNEGKDGDRFPEYPASYASENIISVAATDSNDGLAAFSNFGLLSVDIGAPGTSILSCKPGRRILWSDTFDDGDIDDWATGGTNDAWGLTTAESVSPFFSLADSPSGTYSSSSNSWAKAPPLSLVSSIGSRLDFSITGTSASPGDRLLVEVSTNGIRWINRPVSIPKIGYFTNGVSGTLSSWYGAVVDLGPYDGEESIQIRFRFLTDASQNQDGWYIDDVVVSAAGSLYDGSEYQYLQGTSMASPHVSGVAALVKAQHPDWDALRIKGAIERGADPKASLNGKVASGGRLNAFNALTLEPLSEGLAVDFGALGLRLYDGAGWTQLSDSDAEYIGSYSAAIVGDFGPWGLWEYREETWRQLTSADADNTGSTMVAYNGGLAVDFGGMGLWLFTGDTWSVISVCDAEYMAAYGGRLAADFGPLGLWQLDGTAWERIAEADPDNSGNTMVAYADGLAVDFGSQGLWYYRGGAWTVLSWADPEYLLAPSAGLFADFGRLGMWVFSGTEWSQYSLMDADNAGNTMVPYRGGVAVDFGSAGLWHWDGEAWQLLEGADIEYLRPYGDGRLAADWGKGLGLWEYDGSSWSRISPDDPDNSGNTFIEVRLE